MLCLFTKEIKKRKMVIFVPLNVCWCNHTSQVWVMTHLFVAKEVRESSFHFISPIIPPAVRLQLSDERHKSLLYKHLQSFQKWVYTATPRWQDFEWTLGRVRLSDTSHQVDQKICLWWADVWRPPVSKRFLFAFAKKHNYADQTGKIRPSHDDVERAFTFQART